MAPTMLDHEQAAEKWRYAGSIVQEATRDTDLLGIPTPQQLARGMADLLTFPEEIMRIGRARDLAPEPAPEPSAGPGWFQSDEQEGSDGQA